MSAPLAIGAVCLTFFLTLLIIYGMLRLRFGNVAMDHPNERSLHTTPVPRTGGIALMAGVLAGWIVGWQPWLLPIFCSVAILIGVSFLDDVKGLPPGWRFLSHFVAAGIFLWHGTSAEVILLMLAAVAMVWMTNLFNFMDGSDGLAGGMALFGFGFYALAAWMAADAAFAVVLLTIAAGAAAFLVFNFHPARIFMGDSGSIPLGFLAAAFGLLGVERDVWPLWFPILVFSPFIIDATITLLRRLLQGEKVWQAHRSHYYQRLVQLGWGHRKTALNEYGLMACAGLSAIGMVGQATVVQAIGLSMWGAIYAALALKINSMWARSISNC